MKRSFAETRWRLSRHIVRAIAIPALLYQALWGEVLSDTSVVSDTIHIDSSAASAIDSLPVVRQSLLSASAKTARDSVALKEALRDSLVDAETLFRTSFYQNHDSLNGTMLSPVVRSPVLYATDGIGLSEALRFSPWYVAIPYSLSSSLNRALFQGLPIMLDGGWVPGDGSIGLGIDGLAGTDHQCVTDISSLSHGPVNGASLQRYPVSLVSPVTFLFWENGVLGETVFRVLFARPITREWQVGVYANHRSFSGKSYSHRWGGMYSFYRNFTDDTNAIMNNGRYPLVNEQVSGLRTAWKGAGNSRATVEYRYSDLTDEIVALNEKGSGGGFRWDPLSRYCHEVKGSFNTDSMRPVSLFFNANLGNLVQIRSLRSGWLSGSTALGRGSARNADGLLRLAARFSKDDTVALSATASYTDKRLFGSKSYDLGSAAPSLSLGHHFGSGTLEGVLTGSLGVAYASANKEHRVNPVGSATLTAALGRQDFALYGKREVARYNPPFDTSVLVMGAPLDPYTTAGAEVGLTWRRAGLRSGVVYLEGIDTSTLVNGWPLGIVPYPAPRLSWLVMPSISGVFGLTLWSKWLLSAEQPFARSTSGISYERYAVFGRAHFQWDWVLDYWSWRDYLSYGGITTWNRPIYDMYLKMSLQVKSFRLFYKMDNLLNQKIAYVPGYYMPGLTFRWGFNWLIQK